MMQLEFDFGPENVIQEFKSIIQSQFTWPKDGDYYIKQRTINYANNPYKYQVVRRYYATVEVEWDFVMNVTTEEAEILIRERLASWRN